MKRIIDLVDSLEYTTTNCFGHQLYKALQRIEGVQTVALADVHKHPRPDLIVSRLKQRTLYRVARDLKSWAQETPITVFDQDPWESFKDDSPYKGAYEHIASHLNVKTFAVTTEWWVRHIESHGLPSTFVHMWVLPEYCDNRPFTQRSHQLGFLGSLHPYRRRFFEQLKTSGLNVNVRQAALPYWHYLCELSDIQFFVHSEDCPLTADGKPLNLGVGLWIKDVEAAARGCFTIRNRAEGSETYLSNIKTALLYDDPSEVPALLEGVLKMDEVERQELISSTVEYIKTANKWQETAAKLVS